MDDSAVERFWALARPHAKLGGMPGYFGPNALESVPPPAWSFGADPEQADRLLRLVLDGTKTATASARDDYDAEGEQLPEPGSMSILLDGADRPRALIVTTDVEVVAFDEVGEEHARAEGEGDGSLAGWRADHEQFFTEHAAPGSPGFRPDMPVVLERFSVLFQT